MDGSLQGKNGAKLDDSGREPLGMLQGFTINLNNLPKGTIQYLATARSLSKAIEQVDGGEAWGQNQHQPSGTRFSFSVLNNPI